MNIAVIGCGNMAFPVVSRISKRYPEIKFHTYTPSKVKAELLAKKVNGEFHQKLESIENMDYWLIACKPQQLKSLAESLGNGFKNEKIISILASTSFSTLKEYLNTDKIIRIMPNTPAAIGEGISLMVATPEVSQDDASLIQNYFNSCGEVINVDTESSFDELTVFSGSGPAYVFRFAKAYFQKLTQLGYGEKLGRKLVNQLFVGSSSLMTNETSALQVMIDKVTSKGGVTIEAINVLDQNDLDKIVSNSIDKAIERGKQIAQDT